MHPHEGNGPPEDRRLQIAVAVLVNPDIEIGLRSTTTAFCECNCMAVGGSPTEAQNRPRDGLNLPIGSCDWCRKKCRLI